MMKKIVLVLGIMTLLVACGKEGNEITRNLKYPFAMCSYDGGILISNFGGDTLNYYNTEQKGFISFFKDGKNSVIIEPQSGLYSPKGMAIKDNCLFVADVNRVTVFNLAERKKIDEIPFPQGDAFVSDVLIAGSTMFISVTNYNKIYLLNVDNPKQIDHSSLLEYLEIPYPSSLKMMGEYLFVSSNSFNSAQYDDKIIHIIDNLNSPSIRPIIHEPGDYQGLEFSPSKTRLIFCNREMKGYLGNIVFENGQHYYDLITDNPNALLNGVLLFEDKLYISDLYNSKIFIKDIIEFDGFSSIIKTES